MPPITQRLSFQIGEEATLSRTIGDSDIAAFAKLTGDVNPIHLNDEYAATSRFGGRVAHGMLVASLISTVLGTQLPGPGAVYLGQELRFLAPVRPGDTVTVSIRVTDWDSTKGRLVLATDVVNQDGLPVITGTARLVMASFLKET